MFSFHFRAAHPRVSRCQSLQGFQTVKAEGSEEAFATFVFKSDGQLTDCGLDRLKVTLSGLLSSALPSLPFCLRGGAESRLSYPHCYHLIPLDEKPRSELQTGQKQFNQELRCRPDRLEFKS